MKNRSGDLFCVLGSALQITGERWTLLIIRELLPGPRRFKDLLEGLPGISSNLLSKRLKNLEKRSLLCRRVLPPPAGSTVYELTDSGQALEKAVLELGIWGSQFLITSLEGVALPSSGAMALAIKAFFHPEQAQGIHETYELHLGNEVFQVRIREGKLRVQQGQALKADVVFYTGMQHFVSLFTGQLEPDEAIARGLIRIEGDRFEDERSENGLGALRRFLSISSVPGTH